MAKVIIDEYGTKRYLNDSLVLHREDGPAEITPDGFKRWLMNGTYVFNIPSIRDINGDTITRKNETTMVNDDPNGYKKFSIRTGESWPFYYEAIWPEL